MREDDNRISTFGELLIESFKFVLETPFAWTFGISCDTQTKETTEPSSHRLLNSLNESLRTVPDLVIIIEGL